MNWQLNRKDTRTNLKLMHGLTCLALNTAEDDKNHHPFNQSTNNIFVKSPPTMFYRRHCSCNVFICLHGASRNVKKLKTKIVLANAAARRALGMVDLWCDWRRTIDVTLNLKRYLLAAKNVVPKEKTSKNSSDLLQYTVIHFVNVCRVGLFLKILITIMYSVNKLAFKDYTLRTLSVNNVNHMITMLNNERLYISDYHFRTLRVNCVDHVITQLRERYEWLL